MRKHRYYRQRRRKFRGHRKHHKKRNPIFIGIILMITSLVLFRLSFTNIFLNSSGVFMWSIILSIGLFIAGVLVLIAWWRNNVARFGTWHKIKFN